MNPKAGSAGSVVNLLNEPKFNHQVQVEYDMCHDACKAILQDFFKELREQKKGLR